MSERNVRDTARRYPSPRRLLVAADLPDIKQYLLPDHFADWFEVEVALVATVEALQERVTRLRVARDALDEAATRPASPGEWEDVHNEFMDAVNDLLSPTQETDPESDTYELEGTLANARYWQNRALQERAEKWSLFEAWYAESRWMGGPQWDALVAALSPTQETE